MAVLEVTDDFLHGRGRFAVEAADPSRLGWLLVLVMVFGGLYGAVMASFSGLEVGRAHQLVYVAVKVPLLLLASFVLCLPSFFVLNTVAGLREDFGQALRAVVASQACVAVVLASLAPITLFFYACTADYRTALNFNGAMFAAASLAAQAILRRYYAPLIRKARRHRTMMRFWFVIYVFVAIQMAWVFRPFVGNPALPVTFFREEQWGNAYVEVIASVAELLRR